MKTWQKVAIGVGAALVIGGVAWYSIYQQNQGVITVQTGRVVRQDRPGLPAYGRFLSTTVFLGS